MPMPAALWAAAVSAARADGLYAAARTLHVDYGALKKHLEAADGRGAAKRPTFVELARGGSRPPGAESVGCVIEVEDHRGARRLHLNGLAPADLTALARMAWGAVE
jgi:hypothetical protein